MKSLVIASLLLLTSGVACAQDAVKGCVGNWSLTTQEDNSYLQITAQEVGHTGPACDLVVSKSEYIPALSALTLELTPAKVCFVDAIAARKAYFSWKLPQELRSQSTLAIVINGEKQGSLSLNPQTAIFKGSCP